MFNCPPNVALAQDPAYVLPLFGLAAAEEAIRVSSNKDTVGSLSTAQVEILYSLRGDTLQKREGPDLSWLLELEDEDDVQEEEPPEEVSYHAPR